MIVCVAKSSNVTVKSKAINHNPYLCNNLLIYDVNPLQLNGASYLLSDGGFEKHYWLRGAAQMCIALHTTTI